MMACYGGSIINNLSCVAQRADKVIIRFYLSIETAD